MELSLPESSGSSTAVLRTFSGRILKYPHPFGAMLPAVGREVGRQNSLRGVGTMNKAGVMRIGAMLAVLTVLAGGFAALPYWTASAGDHKIWGLIDECGSQGPSYLQNVIVSLIDAHTGV